VRGKKENIESWSKELGEGIVDFKEKKKWVEIEISDHGKVINVMTVKRGVEELR
jgi:hypothetical protein